MKYQKINNTDELDELIQSLKQEWWGDFSFLNEKSIIIKGIFFEENEHDDIDRLYSDIWFEFGRIIRPEENKTKKGTIFEMLKSYGSSGKYSGLLSREGEVIIPNIYHSINYMGADLFCVEKSQLYGIVNIKGEIVCEVKYDKICDLSEYTIGIVKDGKIGYIDCLGNIVIPMDYLYWKRNPNAFMNGKVLVEKDEKDEEPILEYEIDHYNNIVSKEIRLKTWGGDDYYKYHDSFSGSTAGFIDNDILDAYEGDSSNRWNTD